MPEPSNTQSQTAMKQVADILGLIRQFGTNPNFSASIGNDNTVSLKYDPSKNPSNANNNSSQNAGQQIGTAMQAASKAATPPNLQGIIDPKVLQMLAGNQQNLQSQALQVPQAVGALGYQNAMTDQLNRGPQDLIMGLAGKFYDRMMQGQQAMQQHNTPSANAQLGAKTQRELQEMQGRQAIVTKQTPGALPKSQDDYYRALAGAAGQDKSQAVAWSKLALDQDKMKLNAMAGIMELGGDAAPMIAEYYSAFPDSNVAPFLDEGILRDTPVVVDLGSLTISKLRDVAKQKGITFKEALQRIYDAQKGN